MENKAFLLFILYLCFSFTANVKVRGARLTLLQSSGEGGVGAAAAPAATSVGGDFDVMKYGARGDGTADDTQAFLATWTAVCKSNGNVKMLIPSGNFFLNPVKFRGPCPNVQSIIFQMQGTLKASTDLSKYVDGDDWVEFGWVDHLTLTGGGTFDGQGEVSWPFNKCPVNKNCKVLPTSILFVNTNNTIVKDIKSLNSKFFHIGLLGVQNFQADGITITAPAESPNTDGIHIEQSSGVTIANTKIGTGDDCISIGHGNSQVSITGVTCGPGHGISVGSLGKYKEERDVTGLIVKDSTLTGTDNGIRIKTWENSPASTKATNMTFENIVMDNVLNPIIIDQTYCPYANCDSSAPSRVQISDIKFKNIKGTSKSPVIVTLECSKGIPCQNVILQDINLQYVGAEATNSTSTTLCANVKAQYTGTQNPPPCQNIS